MIVAIIKTHATDLIAVEEFRSAVDTTTAISDFCNAHSPPLTPGDYTGIDADAIDRVKQWAYDFTLSQMIESVYDKTGVITPVSLNTFKDDLISQLQEKRLSRFDDNHILFEYPAASGKMFSCSTSSQDNWTKLETLASLLLVTYPFDVATYDERDSYGVLSMVDLTSILGTLGTAVLTERALYASYSVAVMSAIDESAAQAAAQPYLDL